ncbi:MAG TPA: hypothetical protein VJN96_02710 [Vicinamibacterales bacterium]|nr:hypothetical protein [Vicinamibacterales bacterium]
MADAEMGTPTGKGTPDICSTCGSDPSIVPQLKARIAALEEELRARKTAPEAQERDKGNVSVTRTVSVLILLMFVPAAAYWITDRGSTFKITYYLLLLSPLVAGYWAARTSRELSTSLVRSVAAGCAVTLGAAVLVFLKDQRHVDPTLSDLRTLFELTALGNFTSLIGAGLYWLLQGRSSGHGPGARLAMGADALDAKLKRYATLGDHFKSVVGAVSVAGGLLSFLLMAGQKVSELLP